MTDLTATMEWLEHLMQKTESERIAQMDKFGGDLVVVGKARLRELIAGVRLRDHEIDALKKQLSKRKVAVMS